MTRADGNWFFAIGSAAVRYGLISASALTLSGCGDVLTGDADGPAGSGEPLELADAALPVSFSYDVIGAPIVGQPVAVAVTVESTISDRPMTLRYRAPEAESLTFPDGQAETVNLPSFGDAGPQTRQITVVPQRDGRVFLTVSVSVETDTGAVVRSQSVPIDVRNAAE